MDSQPKPPEKPAAKTIKPTEAAPPVSAAPVAPAVAAAPVATAVPSASKRPDWVDHPPQPSADRYEVAVTAGPWKTYAECRRSLNGEIDTALADYAAWRIGDDAGQQLPLPKDLALKQLVSEEWWEKVDTKFGEPMLNLHALLRFDSQVDQRLREAWTQYRVTSRMVGSAVIFGGVLLLLVLIYGYLKLSLAAARRKSRSVA